VSCTTYMKRNGVEVLLPAARVNIGEELHAIATAAMFAPTTTTKADAKAGARSRRLRAPAVQGRATCATLGTPQLASSPPTESTAVASPAFIAEYHRISHGV
jgi:hypothetical protein